MSKKSFDKRLFFIKEALNRKLTDCANLANHWYINHGGARLDNEEALKQFKEWLS